MGYQKCMELAGAKVLLYEEFGSYQGEWWAKVEYNGKLGWVNGYYGSCSGCDAFEGEFGLSGHWKDEESYNGYHSVYDLKDGCKQCESLKSRMIDFGREYLDNILTQEEAEAKASENLDWDIDAKEMLEFIKKNSI